MNVNKTQIFVTITPNVIIMMVDMTVNVTAATTATATQATTTQAAQV